VQGELFGLDDFATEDTYVRSCCSLDQIVLFVCLRIIYGVTTVNRPIEPIRNCLLARRVLGATRVIVLRWGFEEHSLHAVMRDRPSSEWPPHRSPSWFQQRVLCLAIGVLIKRNVDSEH